MARLNLAWILVWGLRLRTLGNILAALLEHLVWLGAAIRILGRFFILIGPFGLRHDYLSGEMIHPEGQEVLHEPGWRGRPRTPHFARLVQNDFSTTCFCRANR